MTNVSVYAVLKSFRACDSVCYRGCVRQRCI